jgi:hypothetical protein
VAAGYGDAEAKDFVNKHTAVLKEDEVVSTITRWVDGGEADKCLSAGEQAKLKGACAAFGTAWRANYVDRFGEPRMLTPKGHIVEVHVLEFVDMFACGVLRTARRRCTWWTRFADASCARCGTRRPATRRTPCTTSRGRLRLSCRETFTRDSRRRRRMPQLLRPQQQRRRQRSLLLMFLLLWLGMPSRCMWACG